MDAERARHTQLKGITMHITPVIILLVTTLAAESRALRLFQVNWSETKAHIKYRSVLLFFKNGEINVEPEYIYFWNK